MHSPHPGQRPARPHSREAHHRVGLVIGVVASGAALALHLAFGAQPALAQIVMGGLLVFGPVEIMRHTVALAHPPTAPRIPRDVEPVRGRFRTLVASAALGALLIVVVGGIAATEPGGTGAADDPLPVQPK